MKIALTADRFIGIPPGAILNLLYRLGVTGAEVTMNLLRQPLFSRFPASRMRLGLHLPNVGNCGYDFSIKERLEDIERDLALIHRSRSRFRFDYAVFHPPESGTNGSPGTLLETTVKAGLPLLLENVKEYGVREFERFYADSRDVLKDRLAGICLDIPHACLGGSDWRDWIARFTGRIRVIHLSNCDGEEDTHYPFGMVGRLDLHEILTVLKRYGFDGTVNFEIKPPSLAKAGLVFDTYLETAAFFGIPVERRHKSRMKHLDRLFRMTGPWFPGADSSIPR